MVRALCNFNPSIVIFTPHVRGCTVRGFVNMHFQFPQMDSQNTLKYKVISGGKKVSYYFLLLSICKSRSFFMIARLWWVFTNKNLNSHNFFEWIPKKLKKLCVLLKNEIIIYSLLQRIVNLIYLLGGQQYFMFSLCKFKFLTFFYCFHEILTNLRCYVKKECLITIICN